MGRKKVKSSIMDDSISDPQNAPDNQDGEITVESVNGGLADSTAEGSFSPDDEDVNVKSRCSHMPNAVLITREWMLQASKVTFCDLCSDGEIAKSRWLCLNIACSGSKFTVLCGMKDKNHVLAHQQNYCDHYIFVNLNNTRIYCSACNAEVDKESNDPTLPAELRRALMPLKRSRRPTLSKDSSPKAKHRAHKKENRSTEKSIAECTQGAPVEREAVSNRPFMKNMEDIFEDDFPKGLTGLFNHGNTCYFNAAIQALSSCPPFSDFFRDKGDLRPFAIREPTVSNQMTMLIQRLWSPQRESVTSPKALLMKVRENFAQFCGWNQQDSQELIRCLLELIHRELSQPVYSYEDYSSPSLKSRRHNSSSSGDSDQFETADSGWSSDGDTPSTSNDSRDRSMSRSDTTTSALSAEQRLRKNREPVSWRSIVTDVFDGSIESSVKCLTCQTVSKTIETFQDISLSIPSQEQIDRICDSFEEDGFSNLPTTSKKSGYSTWESWWMWLTSFFLPNDITLEECLAAFFSPDRLVGDDMYSCEKCKKLRNGLKQCRIKRAPEVLSIHIKRFRHDSYSSSKVTTKVRFPLVGLNVGPYSSDGVEQFYDLCGIVTHEGSGADSGHYLAYCRNEIDGNWYEFDDATVTKLDSAYVLTKEAYVLFYQKRCSSVVDNIRDTVALHISPEVTVRNTSPHTYISTEWLLRLNTFADPGPVSNYAFLCQHGHLLPRRADHIGTLCTAVPIDLANLLYKRFGGGPRVDELHYCLVCDKQWRLLAAKKQHERARFREIDEAIRAILYAGDNELLSCHYLPASCINKTWFQAWERFLTEPCAEPPGEIDNSILLIKDSDGITRFNPKSRYMRLQREIYLFLQECYRGGPEVFMMDSRQPQNDEERSEFVREAECKLMENRREAEERIVSRL